MLKDRHRVIVEIPCAVAARFLLTIWRRRRQQQVEEDPDLKLPPGLALFG